MAPFKGEKAVLAVDDSVVARANAKQISAGLCPNNMKHGCVKTHLWKQVGVETFKCINSNSWLPEFIPATVEKACGKQLHLPLGTAAQPCTVRLEVAEWRATATFE